MKKGQLHHIEIYVSNLQESVKFWGWLLAELNYTPYQNWEKGKSWKLGDTYIVLVQTEPEHLGTPYHRKQTGLNHIAFSIDKSEIPEWKSKLADRGLPILYEDKNFDDKIFFEDPDRIKVELATY